MAKQEKQPGFEEALKRLEQLVADMESGRLPLDDMVAAFEEGQKLAALCTGKLNEVERRIEVLTKSESGIEAVPFETPG